MSDIEITLKIIERIASAFEPIIGTFLLLLLLLITLIAYYFKKRITSLAEEITTKSVNEFQKRLDLLFRDEYLRNNLRANLGQRSIDKKLELFDNVYSLYFKYQKSWYFTTKTPQNEIQQLWTDILALRHKIFLNTIYLGPLVDYLMPAVIGMMDGLSSREIKDIRSTSDTKTEVRITESIDKAQKWIMENLATHQDMTMYELKSEILKKVTEQRDKFVENQIEK